MKNHDALSIVSVLYKRKLLFIACLAVCLIIGSFWTLNQIKQANQDYQNYKTQQESTQDKHHTIFIQVRKYAEAFIPENILRDMFLHFKLDGIIEDYKFYAKSEFFDVYVLFAKKPLHSEEIKAMLKILESNQLVTQLKSTTQKIKTTLDSKDLAFVFLDEIDKKGFFEVLDMPYEPMQFLLSKAPINKHYIYLDKNRISSDKYNITSTNIITAHQSLNTNKIWVFMIICAIMIALFITFSAESLKQIRKSIRRIDKK